MSAVGLRERSLPRRFYRWKYSAILSRHTRVHRLFYKCWGSPVTNVFILYIWGIFSRRLRSLDVIVCWKYGKTTQSVRFTRPKLLNNWEIRRREVKSLISLELRNLRTAEGHWKMWWHWPMLRLYVRFISGRKARAKWKKDEKQKVEQRKVSVIWSEICRQTPHWFGELYALNGKDGEWWLPSPKRKAAPSCAFLQIAVTERKPITAF